VTGADHQTDDELTRLRARVVEVEQSNAELTAKNADLEKLVAQLKHMLFARKSERITQDKHPQLPFPEQGEPEPPKPPHVDEAPDDEEFETVTFKRRKRGATRISKDLPREIIRIELPEDERRCPCCNVVRTEIGEEVSERLDYTPAVLKVIETRRVMYACKEHEEAGVATPPVPVHPIEKGMATAGLLAHTLVAKFKDHLPLYRQSCIFSRYGAEIAESTLCDWVKDAAEMLSPVVAAVRASVLESHVVQSDDTGITVLDRAHPNGSRRSFLWAYVGDRDEVVFDFTMGRGREGPREFLGGYRGFLQVDAYSGYDASFENGHIVEVGCWAHARRRFFKAVETNQENASTALAVMQRLYAIEREAKQLGLDFGKRRERRQQESKPLLDAMRPWLEGLKPTVLPKSPMGEAIGYVLRQWDPLTRYLDDGRLDIDNNRVERQMRTVAVGRKNWMFAGSDAGARRAATIYSLVCTCGLLGVEPWAYLKDVLQRIAEGEDPAQLTPRLWKAARAQATAG
jgi:transposase